MKKLFFLLFFVTFLSITAQEEKAPPQKTWLPVGFAGLNISQLALENWTQGGEDALAFMAYTNFGLDYFSNPWAFTNKLKLAYGQTKLGSKDFRTTDNEIFLENLLTYNAGWFAQPYFSNTVRTVLTKGYTYKDDIETHVSNFFDPGYINQSIGLSYKASESFSTRLGLGFQETIASEFASKYTDDSETTGKLEKFKFDTGIESVSNLNLKLDDDLLYTSELRLFGTFDALDVWDVRWDNIVTAQITKLINVNLNILLIYDVDQTKKTQLKEGLQIGITYTLF
ncbi:MAG: hypothetical protein CR986_04910 [Ignavibacteriae bacterium]|nr:MAG: hypothetical protein CR986_04910 [Ignavibacteriota bacterium]